MTTTLSPLIPGVDFVIPDLFVVTNSVPVLGAANTPDPGDAAVAFDLQEARYLSVWGRWSSDQAPQAPGLHQFNLNLFFSDDPQMVIQCSVYPSVLTGGQVSLIDSAGPIRIVANADLGGGFHAVFEKTPRYVMFSYGPSFGSTSTNSCEISAFAPAAR